MAENFNLLMSLICYNLFENIKTLLLLSRLIIFIDYGKICTYARRQGWSLPLIFSFLLGSS
jgi:hypothetical protein